MKRYLGVPYGSNNAITYFLTETRPLDEWLKAILPDLVGSLGEFGDLKGAQLTPFHRFPPISELNIVENVPSWFWRSRTVNSIPCNPKYRQTEVCREIFDLDHSDFCKLQYYHLNTTEACLGKICHKVLSPYHQQLSFCDDIDVNASQ